MEVQGRHYKTILQFLAERGERFVRRIDEIPPDDPRRPAARKVVLEELEAIQILRKSEEDVQDRLEQGASNTRREEEKARIKAERARWAHAHIGSEKGLAAFFDGRVAVYIRVNRHGRTIPFDDPRGRKAEETFPILWPRNPHCVIMFPEDQGEELAVLYDFPTTLSWTAGGAMCFMFRRPPRLFASIRGDKVCVACYEPPRYGIGAPPVFAPLRDVQWIVEPSKALPRGKAELPPVPDRLASLLEVSMDSSSDLFDNAILTVREGVTV